MNRLIIVVAVLLTTLCQPAYAQSKVLRIAADGTFPPFTHIDIDGKFSGFDADLARSLCKELKRKCELIRFDWHSLSAALRSGKADLIISALPIRDEQRKLVTFSTTYLQIPIGVAVRKDSLIIAATPDEMTNARLGVLISSPQFEYANAHLTASKLKQYDKRETAYLDMANGKIDVIADNPILLDQWLNSPDGKNCCRLLGNLPYDPQINGEGFGIAIAKDQVKLLKLVNQALDKLRASGEIAKIQQSHLPFLN